MCMLKTVRAMVHEPYVEFDTFYNAYIMGVQDLNLDYELSRLRRVNIISIRTIGSLLHMIDTKYTEVLNFDSGNNLPKCI